MLDCIIYILVPVHNRCAITKRFAKQLLSQTSQAFHLVLLDDGSNDGTAETVKELLADKVTVLKGKGEWWWGGALEAGYHQIRRMDCASPSRVIVGVMNDDTMFDDDFLSKVASFFATAHETDALLATAIDEATGHKWTGAMIDWFPFRVKLTNTQEGFDCASGRALFMKRERFVQSGGFWAKRIPHYFCDFEFTFRLQKRGVRIVAPADITIRFSSQESGAEGLNERNVVKCLRTLLSNKSKYNPIPWSWFIMRHQRNVCIAILSLCEVWGITVTRAFLQSFHRATH
jgi:GT2 family glycosyltransferase